MYRARARGRIPKENCNVVHLPLISYTRRIHNIQSEQIYIIVCDVKRRNYLGKLNASA